jgi:hypothetical protein
MCDKFLSWVRKIYLKRATISGKNVQLALREADLARKMAEIETRLREFEKLYFNVKALGIIVKKREEQLVLARNDLYAKASALAQEEMQLNHTLEGAQAREQEISRRESEAQSFLQSLEEKERMLETGGFCVYPKSRGDFRRSRSMCRSCLTESRLGRPCLSWSSRPLNPLASKLLMQR